MNNKLYVELTAEAIGLQIPGEYLAGTVLNFERTAAMARQVMEFPLTPQIEPAFIFTNEHFLK